MIRIYRIKDPSKVVFQSLSRCTTPYLDALTKLGRFLHLRYAALVLKPIAQQADDVHLNGSDYQTGARELIHLVFRASGYDLQWVDVERDGEMISRYGADEVAL